MTLETIFDNLSGGIIIWATLCLTSIDVILGILHSLKTHRFKSSINKAGIINEASSAQKKILCYNDRV